MTFKDWLLEQDINNPALMTMGQNPTQDQKSLGMAVNSATKMPQIAQLATTNNGNNPKQVQQGAIKLAQDYLKQNPSTSVKSPNVTAPAIANGVIQQVAGNSVPQIGGMRQGFQSR